MTDFLKQYRKTAGLVSKENARDTTTPTKQSQMYMSQTSTKTPTRTQQIAKKVAAQRQQVNSANPFGRIDTNRSSKNKNSVTPRRMTNIPSSRSALKGQMQPDIELKDYSPPKQTTMHSSKLSKTEFKKANYSTTRPQQHTHSSSLVAKQYQQTKISTDYTNPVLKAADSNRSSQNITPLKYRGTRDATSYDLKATQSHAAKRGSISYSKTNQQITTPKPAKQVCSFANATPSATGRVRESARTPVNDNQYAAQPAHQIASKPKKFVNLTKKQRDKLEEEAELNALKNAKILTTKKLFFPEEFKVKKQPSVAHSEVKTPNRRTKTMLVNLESEASEIIEPSMHSTYGEYHPKRRSTLTTQPATYQESADGYPDNRSNKSGVLTDGNSTILTNGGRRSRKDRSGYRNQSKEGRTTIKKLATQTSILTQQPQPTHQVRLLPGSDTMSLDIKVEGMSSMGFTQTEDIPTPMLETVDSVNEHTIDQINKSFSNAVQKSIDETNKIDKLQTKPFVMNKSYARRNVLENPTFEYAGALNAYVQQSSFARARTPITLEDKYTRINTASKIQSITRDSRYSKRHSVTPNYTETHLTPQQSYAGQDTSFGQVKDFTIQKSAPRSSFMGASRNHHVYEAANTSAISNQNTSILGANRKKSMSTMQQKRPSSTPIVTIERASEKLEKITAAFRQMSLSTFDILLQIKRPTQMEFDAARLLCLFVNAFRDIGLAWPTTQFDSWQTIVQFLMNSPSANKVCLEIQNIKKKVLRPHLAKIQPSTYDELRQIQSDFLENRTERAIQCLYSGLRNKPLKNMVMVVLTSASFLLPKEQETEAIEQQVEQPQQFIYQNPLQVQDSPEHIKNFDCDIITNVEVPTMEMQSVHSIIKPKQQNLFMNQEVSLSHVVGGYDTNQVEEQSIVSSRGSAWPSNGNRLTPYYTEKKQPQIQTSIPQKKQRRSRQNREDPVTEIKNRSRQNREDPVTEIKRVPYKINLKAESDMFEDISSSMEQDESAQDDSGNHLNLFRPDQSCQSESFNVEVQPIKTNNQEVAGFTLSRATLLTDKPSDYSFLPESKPVLAFDNTLEESVKGLHNSIDKLNQTAQCFVSSNLKLTTADLYSQIISPSKMASPDMRQCLNLRRESVGDESDSILNSQSPSIHKSRLDWNVISPKKLFSPEKPFKQLSVLQEECSKNGPDIDIEDTEDVLPEPETSELTNELTDEEEEVEMPATEIRMSFSPSKLSKMAEYVNQQNEHKKQSGTFELKQIEMQESFKAATSNTTTYNAGFMEKMRQKRSESQDSPRQKELRFKEMRDKRLRDIEAKLAKWD